MGRFVPEPEEVHRLREKSGRGLQECKRDLTVEKLSFELANLRAGALSETEKTLVSVIDVMLGES